MKDGNIARQYSDWQAQSPEVNPPKKILFIFFLLPTSYLYLALKRNLKICGILIAWLGKKKN